MRNSWTNGNVLLNIKLILIALLFYTNSAALGDKVPMDPAENLKRLGYPVDTLEEILAATKSPSYFVRHQALEVLTRRIGKEAIRTLKSFLDDREIEVRIRAAHLLGTLGDRSGLEQMRQDFQQIVAQNKGPLPIEPNADQRTIEQQNATRNFNLRRALEVTKVLAELGDPRGYDLATEMALAGPQAAQRYTAIHVLVEIAKIDKAALEVEGIDPITILCAVAESEKARTVFFTLINLVQGLGPDAAIRVLQIAKDSPNQSELARRGARRMLEKVRAKLKTPELEHKY